MKKKTVITSDQVYTYIRRDRPDILDRLGVFFSFSMFSVLKYLFDDQYSFQRPFIAKIGVSIDRPVDVIYQYLSDKDTVEVDGFLEVVAKARYHTQSILATIMYFNKYHLLSDKHKMIRIEKIGVNEEKAKLIEKDVLKHIGNETKAIRDLSLDYNSYDLAVPVSEWLILSVLQKYSTELEVAAPGLFTSAVPLVSKKGKMDPTILPESSTSSFPGDLDDSEEDFDDLII